MDTVFNNAKWIWHLDYNKPNVYLTFTEQIYIAEISGEYKFYISVDSNYALYVNGNFAGTGQYADFPEYKVYDELDITDKLVIGHNNVRIDCYHQGEDSSTHRCETAGVIYHLSHNGKTLLISSENSLVKPFSEYEMGQSVDKVSGQLGYSFCYDSKKITDESKMNSSCNVKKLMSFFPRPIKKLEIYDNTPAFLTVRGMFKDATAGPIAQRMQYAALSFAEPNIRQSLPSIEGITLNGNGADGTFAVIDLASENTGFISLDIDLPCDAQIFIGWGEHLEDMRVRAYVGGRSFCASYFGKAGRNKFINPFLRLGLRYMQIHVYAPSFVLYYAGIRPTIYPVSDNIIFRCADSLHNKIYDVSVRTLLMCMHEHYEDCPWREQALYTMDSRNQMLCGYYAFKEYDFAKASLRLMALSIRDDNMLELCAPARVSITIPSFSAIFLTQVYEYIQQSNDLLFAIEMLPVLRRIAGEFIRRIDPDTGLIACFKEEKYWNFYEWQDGLTGSISGSVDDENITYDAPLNAFVSFGLRSFSDLLRILDMNDDAVYFDKIRLKLNTVIDSVFWNEEKKAYASFYKLGEIYHYCELTQSLIVTADICTDDKLESVLNALADDKLIYVTISHSIFKYDALMRLPSRYARFVFNQIADKWGYMLYNNATTFWETIIGASDFGNAGSLCHGWSAIPIYFYFKYALGNNGDVTGLYECKTDK
ncbi:MAG: alpha-L-rhamnosidase-related protein [Eubacteriales bacterium]